jgi:predicted nucleic acid-binding protein
VGSALRVPGRYPQVEARTASVPIADLFAAATTIAEIERGVFGKERSDPPQGAVLRRWFEDRVLTAFAGRVLPFDLPAARLLATYRVPQHAPLDAALIAAIAQAAQMTVATRHARHFEARLHEASDACMPLQPHASATKLIQAGRGGPGTSAAGGQLGGG